MSYCTYKKCKAPAEYKTDFGNFCPYHFKVLKKKKNLKGEKIELTKMEKFLLKKTRLNKMFDFKLN